jgi:hypothetical protein
MSDEKKISPQVAEAATVCCLYIGMASMSFDDAELREFADIMVKKINKFREDAEEAK